ncbi:MAG: BrnT family toxin [candidate division KSB1 bacterium]|nr:BrnT family toxin [candidate division KSB1 bacterium]MDZ7369263.1 BrnT family toxin [candidate division KSB1 bacterium]MDZ7407298.1 BrnT family toxin [candidate division KSB1 bacterium]
MTFEWHNRKEQENTQKHGVDFTEASTCFSAPLKIEVYDEDHSRDKDRFIVLGISSSHEKRIRF